MPLLPAGTGTQHTPPSRIPDTAGVRYSKIDTDAPWPHDRQQGKITESLICTKRGRSDIYCISLFILPYPANSRLNGVGGAVSCQLAVHGSA